MTERGPHQCIQVSEGCERMDQAPLGVFTQKGMRQWAETGAQEVPSEYEEEYLYWAGDHTLEQVFQ